MVAERMGSKQPRLERRRDHVAVNKTKFSWPRVFTIFGVICGLLIIWFAYDLGQTRAGHNRFEAQRRYNELKSELAAAKETGHRLSEQVALLKTSEKIDSEAYRQVEAQLTQLQAKIIEQQEQLAFYRGIVGPDQQAGLRIQDFKLTSGSADMAYSVHLVLAQAIRNDQRVSGFVELNVEGVRDGEALILNLKDLAPEGESRARLDFSFRYFQNLQADLLLPEGFAPARVIVKLTQKGKSAKPVEKTYDWPVQAG